MALETSSPFVAHCGGRSIHPKRRGQHIDFSVFHMINWERACGSDVGETHHGFGLCTGDWGEILHNSGKISYAMVIVKLLLLMILVPPSESDWNNRWTTPSPLAISVDGPIPNRFLPNAWITVVHKLSFSVRGSGGFTTYHIIYPLKFRLLEEDPQQPARYSINCAGQQCFWSASQLTCYHIAGQH